MSPHHRLAFAKKYLDKSFDRVVFSDEKMFRFRPGYKVGVWRRRGESKYKAKYTVKTTCKSEGLMVWAAINAKGEVLVHQCPKKVKAVDYQDILSKSLSFIKGSRRYPSLLQALVPFVICSQSYPPQAIVHA